MMQKEFDYIVVGGGSGGCAVASRLSEDPSLSVCLIEAGGEGKNLAIRVPAGVAAILPTPFLNWAYKTTKQAGLGGRRGYQPRGRTLGGSSAINAMLYVRGHREDYNEWRDLGCTGWGWDDVLPYFIKSEDNENGASSLHGTGGPLAVSEGRARHEIADAFLDAAREIQYPINEDFNGPEQEGIGHYQVTQRNGERCSAAAAYVHPHLDRPNLTVLTKTRASKLVIENNRANGVIVHGPAGQQHLSARGEIILAGGAFATPQLLMLSGIGDGDHLKSHGIEVVSNNPEVGQNLQDHVDYTMSYYSKRKDVFGFSPRGLADIAKGALEWRKSGTGKLTTTFAESGGFLRSSASAERPDLQLHFVVGIVDDHNRKPHLAHGFSCHVCVLRPESRGHVRLASANPRKAPEIDMGFFTARPDLDLMIQGFKRTKQLLESPALSSWRGKPLHHANLETDHAIEAEIRKRSDTVYHPVGTCRMGNDESSVVDPQLRVRGIDGLRVADASIMPRIIGGNTNAPTIMIGEKCADMIRTG